MVVGATQGLTTERGSLPGPGTPLIARERELSELRDALQAGHRLVTLIGPGGTGKSRLSIALATDVAASYAGGAWFVDLTGLRDPQLVRSICAAVINAVSVPVTLKIRTGYTRAARNGIEIARIAEDCGIAALDVRVQGRGGSRRAAEQVAATAALAQVQAQP